MSESVSFEQRGATALITIDDGKANALSPAVLSTINGYLDRVETGDEIRAVVLSGRSGMFSGGFDLAVMRSGDMAAMGSLVTDGGELCTRLYGFGRPVVIACTGHAVAAGALTVLAGHLRVCAEGPFKIGLNETAIGLVLPDWGIVLAAERLGANERARAAIESYMFSPAEARQAGFFEHVVPATDVLGVALEEAARLGALDASAYAGNAAKVRGPGLEQLRSILARDRANVAGVALGGLAL